MSRDRYRRREEPASSQRPGYNRRSYRDNYGWEQYERPMELLPRRGFNYWRDESAMPTSYSPQRPYEHRRESYDEQRGYDDRQRSSNSSYSRRSHDSGPGHYRGERESRRDQSPHPRSSTRQCYPYTTSPRAPRSTLHERDSTEFRPPLPQSFPPNTLRKTSHSPNKSSQPLKPTPAYLSLSQEPSEILHNSALVRKLLVLDLNGTLLIRSARSRISSGPRLRAVQPRPYMPSFRHYLFCTETKGWLDTMVWSSAQPHSVDDMVDKVFGATKEELKAIWNRMGLGLSETEYHQKTVTTKDLTKPWNLLTSTIPEKPEEHSTVSSQSQIFHSAFSTLLLDDSPHKAVLQPYNHVCIPEYSSARRQHDLRSLLAAKEPKKSKQDKKAKQKNRVEAAVHSTNLTAPELSPAGALSELADKEPYDTTLLAVIGILEAVKLQSNVAGWIRRGGLWAIQEISGEVGALDIERHSALEVEDATTVLHTVVQTGDDAICTSDPVTMPKKTHLQAEMWFDNPSVVAYWVAQGRRALMELGIQIVHGVTG